MIVSGWTMLVTLAVIMTQYVVETTYIPSLILYALFFAALGVAIKTKSIKEDYEESIDSLDPVDKQSNGLLLDMIAVVEESDTAARYYHKISKLDRSVLRGEVKHMEQLASRDKQKKRKIEYEKEIQDRLYRAKMRAQEVAET